MVDLHTHTLASDGRLRPRELVRRARHAGITVLGITDHDTLAGLAEAREEAGAQGLELVDGVEITAFEGGRDIHVLGYFVRHAPLADFLSRQRRARVDRVRAIGRRLAELGAPVDVEALLERRSGEDDAIGRPAVAAALVEAGHAATIVEAFDRFLGRNGAAFVPRTGPDVPEAIARIHAAGGVASLAHPALDASDARIPDWAAAGLDALEAYHSEHDAASVARYCEMARSLGLAVTGGSDYHGDERAARARLGRVTLPREALDRLADRREAVGRGPAA